jgi:signal transduction histidine kinase
MRLRDPNTTAEEFRSTSEEVLAAGEQQERLIESLLILARSQRGLDHHEPFDLAALASDVADAHQAAAAVRGVRVDVSVSSAPTYGDPYLAELLVSNLIENAINYNAPQGHVELLVQQSDQAVLQVGNTGPLVPADDIGRLLRPFQRDTIDRTGGHDGLGLGLSIVVAIAKAHGAVLDIRPAEAGGLVVKVAFPSARSSPNGLAGASPPRAGPETQIVRPDDPSSEGEAPKSRVTED